MDNINVCMLAIFVIQGNKRVAMARHVNLCHSRAASTRQKYNINVKRPCPQKRKETYAVNRLNANQDVATNTLTRRTIEDTALNKKDTLEHTIIFKFA